jgi:hypothetical protein
VLGGFIGGLLLLNGKIALHQAGYFLKNCSDSHQKLNNSFPITLNIINSHIEEVLATYIAIWKD